MPVEYLRKESSDDYLPGFIPLSVFQLSKSAPSGLEPETLPPKGSVIPFHHGAITAPSTTKPSLRTFFQRQTSKIFLVLQLPSETCKIPCKSQSRADDLSYNDNHLNCAAVVSRQHFHRCQRNDVRLFDSPKHRSTFKNLASFARGESVHRWIRLADESAASCAKGRIRPPAEAEKGSVIPFHHGAITSKTNPKNQDTITKQFPIFKIQPSKLFITSLDIGY